ncbi:MAG: PadR family transcriptional regulator [Spirochaetes bacterium RBG_16_49_21]|nr:MAG: PadR family transcriptional regulator [Spirochaetes bacterium RBG_16_49_21]
MADVMIHEFLLGFIKIYILQYAEKEPVYGKEIHDQLQEYGYKISFGTLYNTFHGFEEKGYLIHEDRNINGKIRKYYTLTDRGKEAFNKAKEKAKELFDALYE